jgi:hypothetical protein
MEAAMAATHHAALGIGSGGTDFSLVKVYSPTINPASVASATSAEQTFTVTGLLVGDIPVVVKPTATAGVGIVNARVSAADTLAVTFMNATAGAVDPASETYTVLVFRPAS